MQRIPTGIGYTINSRKRTARKYFSIKILFV